MRADGNAGVNKFSRQTVGSTVLLSLSGHFFLEVNRMERSRSVIKALAAGYRPKLITPSNPGCRSLNISLQLITRALITEDVNTEQEVKSDHTLPAPVRLLTPLVSERQSRKCLRPSQDCRRRPDRAGRCGHVSVLHRQPSKCS